MLTPREMGWPRFVAALLAILSFVAVVLFLAQEVTGRWQVVGIVAAVAVWIGVAALVAMRYGRAWAARVNQTVVWTLIVGWLLWLGYADWARERPWLIAGTAGFMAIVIGAWWGYLKVEGRLHRRSEGS